MIDVGCGIYAMFFFMWGLLLGYLIRNQDSARKGVAMIKASGKGEVVVGFERGKNGETLSKESPDEVGHTYSWRHIGHDNASPPENATRRNDE